MGKTILITGGLGFIGSNFIRHFLKAHPSYHLINLDKLTYSANPENHRELSADPRYHFVQGDILDEALLSRLGQEYPIQAVVHFAAESHVDRSIRGPGNSFKPISWVRTLYWRPLSIIGKKT